MAFLSILNLAINTPARSYYSYRPISKMSLTRLFLSHTWQPLINNRYRLFIFCRMPIDRHRCSSPLTKRKIWLCRHGCEFAVVEPAPHRFLPSARYNFAVMTFAFFDHLLNIFSTWYLYKGVWNVLLSWCCSVGTQDLYTAISKTTGLIADRLNCIY